MINEEDLKACKIAKKELVKLINAHFEILEDEKENGMPIDRLKAFYEATEIAQAIIKLYMQGLKVVALGMHKQFRLKDKH